MAGSIQGLDIRLAQPGDRLELIEVQRRASLAGNDGEVRRLLLERPEIIDLDSQMIAAGEVFVAELDGRIVGFATIMAHEGNDAELEGLFVEPAHWRKGIATQLLHAIEREAIAWAATRLHVLANRNALGFYEASGFEEVGEQETELGPPGLLMVKAVRPQ